MNHELQQAIAERTGHDIAMALGNAMINHLRAQAEVAVIGQRLVDVERAYDMLNLELSNLRQALDAEAAGADTAEAADTPTGDHERA